MTSQGYIRFPNISQNTIVFVSEDDLWLVSSEGGRAERLTAGVSEASYPFFSPNGEFVAFVGREEGPSEVYVMPASGGPAQRLTFQSSSCRVLGWSPNGEEILYASNAGQFAMRFDVIYAVKPTGGLPRQLPYGMANAISYGPNGGVVLGRNGNEMAHWKRYRGGTAGYLWCDATGGGTFQRLDTLKGNVVNPCWIGERIYFLSDQDGIGNVYSCTPHGEDIRQHTTQQDFYARHLSSDGQRLVYHAGAELYLFDPATEQTRQLDVVLPSVRTQRNRKFVSASTYLDTYALHPKGYQVAVTTRSKAFTMGNWEGPVLQHGEQDGVRYRFLEWLNDGKRCVAVCDAPGRETLVLFNPEEAAEPELFDDIDIGRVVDIVVSPVDDAVAITNHRNELLVVALATHTVQLVERSDFSRINGVAWSPDGRWLAYGFPISSQKTAIKLCDLESGGTYQATEPVLVDSTPSFDSEGKYLYFLGHRIFNPVHDTLQFDLSFPRGIKPYAILLQNDLRSPFIPVPKDPDEKDKKAEDEDKTESDDDATSDATDATESEDSTSEDKNENDKDEKAVEPTAIDLEGITERVLPFPVSEGRYYAIHGIKGKVLYLSYPIEGAIDDPEAEEHVPRGSVDCYTFEKYKSERIITGVSGLELARNNKTLIYRSARRLRVVKAGEKPPKSENEKEKGRESGWLDLGRIKVSVQPVAEWKQMFAEAWRLQREQFWSEDMSGIDWDAIYAQYAPLVDRVSSRAELSDLLWELQGELGTSHAYESGGEYRRGPQYRQGFLAVDWTYDAEQKRYRIAHIVKGDPSNEKETSPLTTPGLHVSVGDAVLAINGQRVTAERHPQELLVNQSGAEVLLTIEEAESGKRRSITVKALAEERTARYREWVEENRSTVHSISKGLVGYVHIPDMVDTGYAEFHRSYLAEYDYPALLIDVRWNRGGNVSGLLLEKLARKRLGYDFSRWGQPEPYPSESPRGPMVALTDEHAGSDGDIFSHSFKLMGLGPLIGKRTWGGVIGIHPRHRLVDNTMTTQPEFSFWFKDVGWNVENYGTDPDIDVDIAPQDFANSIDPQLDRAIAEAMRLIEERPSLDPTPGQRPHLGRR